MIKISQIKLPIGHKETDLDNKIRKILRLDKKQNFSYEIVKRSIDARNKDDIFYNYTIDVKYTGKGGKEIKKVTKESYQIDINMPFFCRSNP